MNSFLFREDFFEGILSWIFDDIDETNYAAYAITDN